MERKEVSKTFLYYVMAGMLICGTSNTLVMKYQDATIADGQYYTHPFLQCLFMFVGEYICFVIYYFKQQQPQIGVKTSIHPGWLAIPAALDLVASTLTFLSLTMIDASVYQMTRGSVVVFVPLWSRLLLGIKQQRYQKVGIFLIVLGVFLVSYTKVRMSDREQQETQLLGVILLVIAQLITGLFFVSEEMILTHYQLDPFKVVGTEGMWGCCFFLCLLPMFQVIKCGDILLGPSTHGLSQLCSFGYIENSAYAFYQMSQNKWLLIMSLISIFDISFFNYFGITITKYATAGNRATVDLFRILCVWIASCLLGLEKFNVYLVPGFLLLSTGFFVYNEIIIIPFFGLDKRAKTTDRESTEDSLIGGRQDDHYRKAE